MQSIPKRWKANRSLRLLNGILLCLLAQTATVFGGLNYNVTLASLTNHNTSAYSAYNSNNFPANFGTTSWVNQNGTTVSVDPTQMDMSMNPITPGHVSKTDVHTLVPSRPDLRWFAHATPWFGNGSHINIGVNYNTAAYAAAMVTDMKNRGFNGVIIDWYGSGSFEDQVTQKIKSYLASLSNNTFTYIIMVDKGVGSDTNTLISQIQYCQSQYFSDPNYEREPTNGDLPILMFFGVRSAVGQSAMTSMKAYLGGNMVWVEQGTGYLGESWEDECFDWTDSFNTGVNNSDPFNLSAVSSYLSTVRGSSKKAFGAMCARFNGTLTKSVSWSEGKYLPCSNGLCEVQRASTINSAIPANVTRMQWATWSDWEEGTQVESGIENNFVVTGQVNTNNVLSWSIGGDERTVDHYEIYVSTNGTTAAYVGSVPTGTYQTNLGQAGFTATTNYVYVDAVAKPCIRDHMSPAVTVIFATKPIITQQPTYSAVSYGATATFIVTALGAQPISYTWYDQSNNVVGTNGNVLVITNATQPNGYYVVVANQYGAVYSYGAALTIKSTPGLVTDVQPFLQTVWQGDALSFTVAGAGQPPLSYQWTLNGQNIPGATNPTYAFAALAGTNSYRVTITNSYGSTNSSAAVVVGVPAMFINPSSYYGMQITFSGYTKGVSLVDFPVLVRLSTNIPGFSYAKFVSPNNGADLRFVGANGRVLPFQIDQWNPAGESQVWVQVPSLTTTNDYITACWGNPADATMVPYNTNSSTWTTLSGSNNFLLVYHLSQSGFPYADSTLQYPATSGVAPSLVSGEIGNGVSFNGSSQFLNAGLVNLGKMFTLSAWVNISPSATSEQTIWGNKQGGWNTAGFDFYVNSWQANDGIVYFDSADGTTGNVTPRTVPHAFTFGQWHLLTGTMDGVNGDVHVYVDGLDQTTNNGVDTAFQVTNYVRCGSLLTGTPGATGSAGSYFNGLMDEARIESGVCSPAWVWASWATVARSSFATYGTVLPPAVTLQCQPTGTSGQIVLTWTLGTLQSAQASTGPYSDITGAISPYTITPSGGQQFFRVKVQ